MKTKLIFFVTLIALFVIPASTLLAANAKKDELKKRFQERYPAIRELKEKGVVGETDEGYLDWVGKKDSKSTQLVDDENSDRKELYALLAKETHESPENVAKHAAQRNFEKAKVGEYLKVGSKWHKKDSVCGRYGLGVIWHGL